MNKKTRLLMKGLFFSVFSAATILSNTTAGQALPGDSLSKSKKWLNQHKFLPPTYIEDTSFPGYFWLERKLKNGKNIVFGIFTKNNVVVEEGVRVQVPLDQQDKLNLFDRNNPSTLKLVKLIYGEEIAKDFQESKFIYEGFNYYSEGVHSGDKSKINPPIRNNIFQGKKYVYATSYTISTAIEGMTLNYNEWSFSVSKDAAGRISNLEKEKREFMKREQQRIIKEEKQRQLREQQELLKRRTEPADIDL